MNGQPRLTASEWTLVMHLLDQELSELAVEIHHTRSSQVRDELICRRQMVRSLSDRLRPVRC